MTKAILPKRVYEDNLMGKLAMSLVGDEDAGELFTLLKDFFLVRMSVSDITLEGEAIDMLPDPEMPTVFQKPYQPRTMKIVEHLEKSGYIKLHSRNSRGCAYNVVPPPKSERDGWFNKAMEDLIALTGEVAKADERAAYWRKRAGMN